MKAMPCFKQFTLIVGVGILISTAPAALGQKWEVGAGAGASLYNAQTITSGSTSVEAKFKPGYGFSAFVGQVGDRLGGEVRYTWLSNEMELSGAGKNFTMGGHTQAIHYDVNFYFNSRKSKTRPYLFAGGGMKQYSGKGPATAVQPLGNIVVLTDTSEWKPLISGGGGVRIAVGEKASLRAEFRMYFTQTPTNVITPVSGSLSGWYYNFVPMVNLSYVW